MSIRDRAASWSSRSTPPSSTERQAAPEYVLRDDVWDVARQVLLGLADGAGAFVFFLILLLAYGSMGNAWYRVVIVTSGSMSPVFEAGDMMIVTQAPRALEEGMIIVMGMDDERVTHRIVHIDEQGLLTTQGDANNVADGWKVDPRDPLGKVRVLGLYRGRIRYLGFAIDWLGRALRPGGLQGEAGTTSAEFRTSQTISAPFSAGTWDTPAEP